MAAEQNITEAITQAAIEKAKVTIMMPRKNSPALKQLNFH